MLFQVFTAKIKYISNIYKLDDLGWDPNYEGFLEIYTLHDIVFYFVNLEEISHLYNYLASDNCKVQQLRCQKKGLF